MAWNLAYEWPRKRSGLPAIILAISKAGLRSEALQVADHVLSAFPGDAEMLGARARILFEDGQVEEAESAARIAIEHDASLPQLHAHLSAALGSQGRLDEAIRAARAGLAAVPDAADRRDTASFHAHLGRLLLSVGDLDGAESELTAALRSNPDLPGALEPLDKVRAEIATRGTSE